jgi:nucleoid-associated protein YgaU
MAIIGMKIANGQFYPLLDETIAKKKKLVLAAAHDNQKSVQLDLYKSGLSSMADAQYLGSLVVEIDTSREKDPSIEMTISSSGKGEIGASAKAAGSDKIQHLTVSIPSLEETACDISDTDLEQADSVPNALFDIPPAKKFPYLPILLIVLLFVVVGIGIWFFLFWNKDTEDPLTDAHQTEAAQTAVPSRASPATQPDAVPEESLAPAPAVAAQTATETPAASSTAAASPTVADGPNTAAAPAAQPEAVPEETPAPAVAAQTAAETPAASGMAATSPTVADGPNMAAAPTAQPEAVPEGAPAPAVAAQKIPAPVRSFKVPAKIPAGGVKYKVRWGDTLWDIADVFYNDPWLTNRLARYNKIRNKNVLIPGTIIRIPPKSKLY